MDDSDFGPPLSEFSESKFTAPYDKELERRRGIDPIKEYIAHKIAGSEDRIKEEMRVQFKEMRDHFDQRFKDAFPQGDPHGHRMYHERSIADADKWARVKSAVTEKLISGGVWLLLAFVVLAMWEAFKAEVKK